MKKYLFAMVLLFAIVFVTGCSGGATGEIPFDYTEAVTPPTNLRISGKVLLWDAVEGAKEYIVFAGGVEKATVDETQYDFSSLSGTSIIFQVKTKGLKGKADSTFSASIAYNANPTQEKAAIEGVMLEYELDDVPEGFATELVRKGMTATQMETALEAFQTFVGAVEAAEGDPIAVNTALKAMMETDFNFEAIASAVLVTMAPAMIDEAIAELEAEIAEYESWGIWYEDQIRELEAQIAMYESILDMLEDAPEATLIALVETYDKLLALQADIDNDFIEMLMDLVSGEAASLEDINTQEIILIKDELVAIMEENLPTMEYMVLMLEMAEAMLVSTSEDQVAIDTFKANKSYYAAETILSIQAFTAFIDTIDTAFINEVKTIAADSELSAKETDYYSSKRVGMSQMRILALILEYYDRFLDENDELIDQMEAVFTDEQKEAMFDAYMAELDAEMVGDESLYSVLTNLEYEDLDRLADILDKIGEELLDSLVATESEILLLMATMEGFGLSDLYKEDYVNDATGETYANATEMRHALTLTTVELIGEVLIHLGAAADVLTTADMEFIADFLADTMPFQELAEEGMLADEEEAENVRDNVRNLLKKQLPKLLQLIQDLSEFVSDEEVIDAVLAEFGELNTHFIGLYGSDYRNNDNYHSDSYGQYALVIHFSGWVNQFMNSTHRSIVENLVKAVADLLVTSELLTITDGEKAEVDEYEADVLDAIAFILAEAKVFKGYDKDDLSVSEKARIDAVGPELDEIFS